MPKITIIVPYSNQDPSRIEALNRLFDCINHQDLRVRDGNGNPTQERDYEFIFVEQDTGNGYQRVDSRGIPDKHIIVEKTGQFNKSWCMNVAARECRTFWMCFMDADMLFGKEYLYCVNLWREKQVPKLRFFVGWDFIIKLPGRDEPIPRVVRPTSLTAGGAFWVEKEFFWQVGGMNENYFGYGGEDNDFWHRVNIILGSGSVMNVRYSPYALVHTYHHNAEPSPERFYHLDRTVQHPRAVMEKLKAVRLGQKEGPTLVDVSDLPLEKPSITSVTSRGIVA